MWIDGLLQCGSKPDITIYREGIKKRLSPGERVVADGGYRDASCVTPASVPSDLRNWHRDIRARRIKQFSAVSAVFRHYLDLHEHCFFACANLAQLMISNGQPLFTVDS